MTIGKSSSPLSSGWLICVLWLCASCYSEELLEVLLAWTSVSFSCSFYPCKTLFSPRGSTFQFLTRCNLIVPFTAFHWVSIFPQLGLLALHSPGQFRIPLSPLYMKNPAVPGCRLLRNGRGPAGSCGPSFSEGVVRALMPLAAPSWQPAFHPTVLGPTKHAEHWPARGPKLQHRPDGPFSCPAKTCARCPGRREATWASLARSVPPPPCVPGSLLPSHTPPLITAHICCFFHSFMNLALRFSISNQFMSALHISKHVFKEFRDNGCFLVCHRCFRFLKIFSTMFRTPESEKLHLGVESPLSLHLLEEKGL